MTASDAEPQDGIKRRLVTVSDGRQVNYRRAGSGPPFVLLHGSPRSAQSGMRTRKTVDAARAA